MSSSPRPVSRRTVARGLAWTAPVALVSVAAPAFAVSPTYTPAVTALGGCRCGTGGGTTKPYRLDVTFSNVSSTTFTITNPDIVIAGASVANVALLDTTPAQNNQVPPGVKTIEYRFTRGNNPVSDSVTFNYTVTNLDTSVSTNKTATFSVTWGTCDTNCA